MESEEEVWDRDWMERKRGWMEMLRGKGGWGDSIYR